MTPQQSTLDAYKLYTGNGQVIVGKGNLLNISHFGYYGLSNYIKLLDILVVPHLTKNLLSISKLTSNFLVDIIFSNKSFKIQNR